MYFLYILKNLKGELYKGITDDLQRRVGEHNRGKSPGTRGKGPWTLIYYEDCVDRLSARKREKYFKSGSGRENLKKLINHSLVAQR